MMTYLYLIPVLFIVGLTMLYFYLKNSITIEDILFPENENSESIEKTYQYSNSLQLYREARAREMEMRFLRKRMMTDNFQQQENNQVSSENVIYVDFVNKRKAS